MCFSLFWPLYSTLYLKWNSEYQVKVLAFSYTCTTNSTANIFVFEGILIHFGYNSIQTRSPLRTRPLNFKTMQLETDPKCTDKVTKWPYVNPADDLFELLKTRVIEKEHETSNKWGWMPWRAVVCGSPEIEGLWIKRLQFIHCSSVVDVNAIKLKLNESRNFNVIVIISSQVHGSRLLTQHNKKCVTLLILIIALYM